MKKKTKLVLFLAPVVIVLSVGGYYSYRGMMHRHAADAVVLPDFEELGPGPRAPSTNLLGLVVGRSTFDDVKALATKAGLDCKDTSARALMKVMRDAKIAAGEPVDAVSSASAKKKSPMEQNPQIRYSCEDTKTESLADRERGSSVGRVLVVLDSPDHPVRHASFRRNHKTAEAAWADATATLAAFEARFGAPTAIVRPFPDAPSEDTFPRYTQSRYEWSYADLKVMLNVMGTPRGVDVLEALEVPWPIRSDAPQLPPVSTAVAEATK